MITITLLIMFDKNKYNEIIYPALMSFKNGDIEKIESLIEIIDRDIVIDFWNFSDIPEDDEEFNNFFEDFILAIEEEIIQSNKLSENIDRATLRDLIINMLKCSNYDQNNIPSEILKRITMTNDLLTSNQNFETEENYFEDEKICDKDILNSEMYDILEQIKNNGFADPDSLMYFKARLIEGFCIPVKRKKYRYDLSANLLNVFLYSLSKQIKNIMKCKNKGSKLLPILEETDKEIAEDIFDRYLGREAIIDLIANIDSLIFSYNIENEFEKIDKIIKENVKGEWWKKMSDIEKRNKIKSWWSSLEELRLFLQDALNDGYDILISTI